MRYKVPELSVLVLICSLSLLAPLSATATSAAAIAGASVEASGPGYGVATVTAGGGYTIAGLYAAGGYNVSARAVGFVEAYHSTLAAVTLGQVTSGVDFTLMRSSIVTGKVTGPTGAPVAGATVTLEDNTTAVEAGSDVTTSDGVYAIETGVAAGVYKIEVTPPYGTSLLGISCSSFLSLCPDDSAQVPGFLPMTVASVSVGAQATVTKNIQLAASAAVEGKVTFDGVGVSGVVVSTNASCFCYSVTNSTGWYVLFSSLPTGNYRVTLSPPLASVLSAHVIAAGSAVVHATAGLVTRQDFSVSASAVISGYVKDQHGNAVAGAVVDTGTESCAYGHCFMTCDDSGLSCATNTTDASGHYTLETGIAAGSYNVTATKGSAKAGLSPLIPVTAGATVNAPQITLNLAAQAVARITGTVKDSHGSPLAGAYVSGEGIGCSCGADNATDSMGQFVLEIAVPSTVPVNVSASSTGYTGAFTIVPGVSAGGAYSAGTLSLTAIPAASISGTVQGQILSTFIQPMRVQKWSTSGGAKIVTKTDSELSVGLLGGLTLSGQTVIAYVEGPEGTSGSFTVSIPKSLVSSSSWTVRLDGNPVSSLVASNSTYTSITVTYSHSSHTLEFAPAGTTTSSTSSSATSSTRSTSSSSSSSTSSSASSSTTRSTSSTSSSRTTSSSTTSSSTTSSSSTSRSSSSTSSQTTSTSSSTSESGGGVPEFPVQPVAALAFTAIVLASYILIRHRPASGRIPAAR